MRGHTLLLIGVMLLELVFMVSFVNTQAIVVVKGPPVTTNLNALSEIMPAALAEVTGVPENGGDLKGVSRSLVNSIPIPYSGYDFHSIIRSSDKGFVTAEAADVTVQGIDYQAGLVVKYDSDGKKEWDSTHIGRGDSEEAFYIVETSDGYAVAGTSFDPAYTTQSIQPYDISLYKIDSKGKELWSKTYDTGKNNSEKPRALLLTQDDGFVIIGDTDSMQPQPPNQMQTDLYIVKTTKNGDVQWGRVYGDPQYNDFGYAIIQTNDHGYAIVGAKYVSQDYGVPWESRAFLMKIGENGDLQWTKTYGGTKQMFGEPEAALSVLQTNDEGYVLAGHTNSFGAGKSDVYFIKTDNSGKEEWSWTYGGPDDDGASAVTRTNGDGGYLMGGYTYRVNSNGIREMDSYIIKTNKNGNMEWGIQEEVPARNDEILPSIFLQNQAGGNYVWAKNVPEDKLVLVDEVKVQSSSATPTPSPATTVSATTDSGATVDLAISGSITSSQMSNVKISTDLFATTATVSFNVTGESGTTGFGNVTIPKSAVPYGSTPTVYIDNQPAQSQGYTQDANNYYVWYTTQFSTHNVSIVFTTTSTPTTSPTPPFANFHIAASAGPGGTISPDGTQFTYPGSGYTYTITPDVGFKILDVTVDGVSQGDISTYSFTNIQGSHEISATFASTQTPTSTLTIVVVVGIVVAVVVVGVLFGVSRARKRAKSSTPGGSSLYPPPPPPPP